MVSNTHVHGGNALSNLEAILETLDEEDAKAIRDAMAEKDSILHAKALAERDLKLATDKTLRDRYPRTIRAYQDKLLDLGETVDQDELVAVLKREEEKLAKLGVPIQEPEPEGENEAASQKTPLVGEEGNTETPPAPDPAQAWGTPPSGGGAGPSAPRSLTQEFLECMKTDSGPDRDRMVDILGEMNAKGLQSEIEQLVDMLNASPIVTRDVV